MSKKESLAGSWSEKIDRLKHIAENLGFLASEAETAGFADIAKITRDAQAMAEDALRRVSH